MSRPREQVIRFAVGSAAGPRSRTWRLWVRAGKSDVYVSDRRVASAAKVSLHEPGPSRFALTSEYVKGPNPIRFPDGDQRRPIEWDRTRPSLPDAPLTRALAILVPHEEVMDRGYAETTDDVVWTAPPGAGMCVEYDVIYSAAGLVVGEHPGSRAMRSQLVGTVDLANGERVWLIAWEHPFEGPGRERFNQIRRTRVQDAAGERIDRVGMIAFGIEGGVGRLVEVTVPDEPVGN